MSRKKYISKTLKNKVWNTNIGQKYGTAPCYCCKEHIDSKTFEAGHIKSLSSGGETRLENLKPICSTCNKSMGKKHMHTFMRDNGFNIPYYDDNEPMDTSPDYYFD